MNMFDSSLTAGTLVTVAGYGAHDSANPSTTTGQLYIAQTPYQQRTGSEFIAGVSGSPDTCKGDSGGPVYITVGGTMYTAGITSRPSVGDVCGSGGIYEVLGAFESWLQTTSGGAYPPAYGVDGGPGSGTPLPGCSCRIDAAPPSSWFGLWIGFGVAVPAMRRRRGQEGAFNMCLLALFACLLLTSLACNPKGPAVTASLPAQAQVATPPSVAVPLRRGPPPFADELKGLVASSNAFGLDLFAGLRVQKGNLAISPLSLSTALTMTWAGAGGETAREIQKVLHLSSSAGEAVALTGKLIKSYEDPALGVTLHIADRLFGEKTFRFRQAFLDSTGAAFGAPLEPVDFLHAPDASRQRINAWVSDATHDRIKDLVPPGAVDAGTRLALVNAMYFFGTWREQFPLESTKTAAFHLTPSESRDVPTMRRNLTCGFAAADGVQVLELAYKGSALAMTLVLPDAVDGLDAVEKRLSPATLEGWTAAMVRTLVDVALPRFEIDPTTPLALARQLKELGMVLAFDEAKADFSGLAEPPAAGLYVSGVFHKAFVNVDEKGTEAAAASAVIIGWRSAPQKPKVEVHVDHPFLFLIRDVRSGMILFMGRVADPTAR
jgi:serpin B